MTVFVKEVLEGISTNDEKLQISYLKNRSIHLTGTWSTEGEDPLAVIDPKEHPISYLCILQSRIEQSAVTGLYFAEDLIWAERYAEAFRRPSCNAVMEEVTKLCHTLSFSPSPAENHESIANILVLIASLWGLSSEAHQLSPVHAICSLFCLEKECYFSCLGLLEIAVTDVNLPGTTAKDFLLYHYYGGLVLLALGKMQTAHNMLFYVLYTPGNVTSAVQIEAYKKLMITNFLLKGKAVSLPAQMTMHIQNVISDKCSRAYRQLEEALENCDFAKMEMVLTKHSQAFEDDGNYGLVRQCAHFLVSRKIQLLTQTYLTLSLIDMEKLIGAKGMGLISPMSLEGKICQMIQNGNIHASICKKGMGVVSFYEPPCSDDQVSELHHKIDDLLSSSRYIKQLNRDIGASHSYLSITSSRHFFGAE